jgi:hypothetical protein
MAGQGPNVLWRLARMHALVAPRPGGGRAHAGSRRSSSTRMQHLGRIDLGEIEMQLLSAVADGPRRRRAVWSKGKPCRSPLHPRRSCCRPARLAPHVPAVDSVAAADTSAGRVPRGALLVSSAAVIATIVLACVFAVAATSGLAC